ncbi:hypothetical protein FA95DRAFT_1307507 [Auriscalpium vulgare]|uniref:Uncharacterized protein n=1 Tax=Auriscalpium vulgare TaxID=40419 RepID=A0ACB8RTD8_9AGAM|nr:hypothetical protein FA95DRAFT_1307507 [Auriscalpium vulgare]
MMLPEGTWSISVSVSTSATALADHLNRARASVFGMYSVPQVASGILHKRHSALIVPADWGSASNPCRVVCLNHLASTSEIPTVEKAPHAREETKSKPMQ